MQDEFLYLHNQEQLEKLYRQIKVEFKTAFTAVYPILKGTMPAKSWHERLSYESEEISWGRKK